MDRWTEKSPTSSKFANVQVLSRYRTENYRCHGCNFAAALLGKANIVVVVVVSLHALPLFPVMTNAKLLPKDDIIRDSESNLPHPFHAAVVKPVNEYVPPEILNYHVSPSGPPYKSQEKPPLDRSNQSTSGCKHDHIHRPASIVEVGRHTRRTKIHERETSRSSRQTETRGKGVGAKGGGEMSRKKSSVRGSGGPTCTLRRWYR
jgi:hypothetical protein